MLIESQRYEEISLSVEACFVGSLSSNFKRSATIGFVFDFDFGFGLWVSS